MTLESVGKLREFATSENTIHAGSHSYLSNNRVLEYLEAIEREIAEKYMELPLDADGIPVHIGDKMLIHGSKVGTVVAIGESGFTARVEGERQTVCNTMLHHRVKPDKLRERVTVFVGNYADSTGPEWDEECIDAFCADIREMAKEGEL